MRLRLRWTKTDAMFAEAPGLYAAYLMLALVCGFLAGLFPIGVLLLVSVPATVATFGWLAYRVALFVIPRAAVSEDRRDG